MRLPVVLTLAILTSICSAAPVTFFIAPDGSDEWSGTLDAPNAGRTDGPFATIARAQQAVRDALMGTGVDGARVLLRGGVYYLDRPLELTPEDTAGGAVPVVYAAYENETPIISGGREITDWEITDEGRWTAQLPEVESGEWAFSQLFVNDQRRLRPRLPKTGYYYIAGEAPPTANAGGKGFDRFRFVPGDMRSDWSRFEDIEVLPFHLWEMSRLRLAEVDEDRSVVTLSTPTCSTSWWSKMAAGHRYIVENVPDALTEQGEWYVDRQTGVLTYIPRDGETPDTSTVIAPRLPYLVQLKGDADVGLAVENLTFKGLTFAHTNWVLPERGQSVPQAEVNIRGAIRAQSARNVSFEQCRITRVGGYAIEFGAGSQNCRVEDCELSDMGAGGVKIGSQGYTGDEARITSDITVRNCVIAHGGRLHPAGIGVLILHSPRNLISHNDIHDFYYTGISVGWQWSYASSNAHDNTIEYNDVHTIGQGVLSDMGGIYTLGPSPGTVIRNNVFHGIESYSYGGRGIYFDQATTGILAENNLAYDLKVGAFCMHFGKDNRVVNNIFALGRQGMIEPVRKEEHQQFDFERNIVYWRRGPLFISNASGSCYTMKSNLYWNPVRDEVTVGKLNFADWQATGQDEGSLIADPLFVDPENGDFTLKPGSPASEIGFVPFDPTQAGREASATRWVASPPVPRAYPPPPAEAPAIPLWEDLELADVGEMMPGFRTYEDAEVKGATARVTDETAASGKHSLKLTDLPGQEFNYNPHVYHSPHFASGVIVGSFDLRMEQGARFYHGWRTAGHPYVEGPTLRIADDEILRAGGVDLTAIPLGQWVHIEVECSLGDEASGQYSVTVTLPGQEPERWEGLNCDPNFDTLAWFGFTAEGTEAGAFYLDSIRLEERKETE